MNTPELKTKIEAAANLALADFAMEFDTTLGTFFYGPKDLQNNEYNEPLPHIYCDPLQDNWNPGTGDIEWPALGVACFEQDTADSSAAEQADIMARQSWLSERFIKYFLLDDDDMPDDIKIIRQDVLHFGQGMLSGKFLQFPAIKDKYIIC